MSYYNNWGTLQPISDNVIAIDDKNNIILGLEEPFDGDESCDVLEDVLKKWFPTHNFIYQSENFDNLINDVYKKIPGLHSNNIIQMEQIIKELVEAKTMMK